VRDTPETLIDYVVAFVLFVVPWELEEFWFLAGIGFVLAVLFV
jgi:hypothetical protein